jgi:hypothetical protein
MKDISHVPAVTANSGTCDMGFKMFKKGDVVTILPEFQDDGDDQFTWMVLADEEKGRVDICPVNSSLRIKPVYTLRVGQIAMRPVNS